MLAEERIADDEMMVSFDVKSLYTSLPVKRTIVVVREKLEKDDDLQNRTPLTAEEISTLPEICLTLTYFTLQGLFYHLTDGAAMGSQVSSVVANIYMEHLEKNSSAMVTYCARVWKRYVDDVFFDFEEEKHSDIS